MTKIGKQKVAFVAALLVVGSVSIALLRRGDDGTSSSRSAPTTPAEKDRATELGKEPRLVLSRPWFDHYPKTRGEEVDLWWFSGAGIGIHDRGSVYRATTDFFEFERNAAKIELTFLHDKKKETVSFEIVACEDKPPFDLCLDVKEPLRGKKRLYSFAYDDELDANVPWARSWRASAEARIRTAR